MAIPLFPNDQSTAAGSIPVRVVSNTPSVGLAYSKTGGATVANTATVVAVANAARRSFTLQNTSTADMWFSYATAPVIGGPSSFKLAAGLFYEPPPGYATNQQINIISSAAQTYSYMEV